MGNLPAESVQVVERLALHAWLLRHAEGVTRRANSVWPNKRVGGDGLETQIARVEAFYHERGLPARFQICPAMQPPELDEVLAARGYRATARTAVQTALLDAVVAYGERVSEFDVEISLHPSAAWWRCYAEADDIAPGSVPVRQAICAGIVPVTAYASIIRDGKSVAVASSVLEAEWVGFFNVATLLSFRRMGAARMLMSSLAKWGAAQGASRAYLQVMAENGAALHLYSPFGFTTGYFYHYREEVQE